MNPFSLSLFYVLICLAVAFGGRRRRFGFWGYFFASLFLTPPVGLLLVIASAPPAPADRKAAGGRDC